MLIVLDNIKYFSNIAISLYSILCKTKDVLICNTINFNLKDDTYIIFNIKDIDKTPKKYIVYNFEQLDTNNLLPDIFWERLNMAQQIWDYSKVNIDILEKRNLSVTFVPFGWNIHMKNKIIYPFSDRINNVMFIGYINERRRNILKPVHTLCKNNNLTMFLSNSCWDEDYKHKLSITKIALNIHYYEGKTILEVHRIIPYILNKIWVITEKSQDPYYDNLLDGLVTWVDDVSLISSEIHTVLNMDPSIVEQILAERQRKLIECCSYVMIINSCLHF